MRSISLVILLVAIVWAFPVAAQPDFIRGDCANDGRIDILDSTFTLNYLFVFGWPTPDCFKACDSDDDGTVNLVDAIVTLNYLFIPGATPPPAPFPACGSDPTADGLSCSTAVCSPSALPEDTSYTLSLGELGAFVPGSTAEVASYLEIDPAAAAIASWSFGVCHDSLVDIVDVVEGAATTALSPDFNGTSILPGEGWTVGVVADFFFSSFLPPGPNHELHVATYDVLGAGTTTLAYCNTLGSPLVDIVLVDDAGDSFIPGDEDAVIPTGGGAAEFVRGDCQQTGAVNIADAAFAWFTLLVAGAPDPACESACDANDDGIHDLADGTYVLNYLALDGAPPPAPFPDCTSDPSPDGLSCVAPDCSASPPPLSPDHTLRFSDPGPSQVATETSVSCLLDVDPAAADIGGWSLGVCHDGLVSINDVSNGADTTAVGATFVAVEMFSQGWTAYVVIDFLGSVTLDPGTGLELHVADYFLNSVGTSSITYCSGVLNNPPVRLAIADEFGIEVAPGLESLDLEIVNNQPSFRRGDLDGDGLPTLGDSVAILGVLFLGVQSQCLDAVDINDDGLLALNDAVIHLCWLFCVDGVPPADPVLTCGTDPTMDALDCAVSNCP